MRTDDPLAGIATFSHLSPAERAVISGTTRVVQFPAGERLFDEGESADGCWLIQEGRIALDIAVPGRGDVVVQTLGPGDLLGWSWLVAPFRWHFGARAVQPTTAVAFDTARLRELAEADPAFGYALVLTLFTAVLQRLQTTRARLLDLYRGSDVH